MVIDILRYKATLLLFDPIDEFRVFPAEEGRNRDNSGHSPDANDHDSDADGVPLMDVIDVRYGPITVLTVRGGQQNMGSVNHSNKILVSP